MQFLQAVEPGTSWYVPAAQLSHSASREVAEKVPGEHGTATVEPGPHACPIGHSTQFSCAVSPLALEKVPPAHGTGTAVPSGHA